MQNGSHARAVNFFLNSKGGVGKSHHAVFMVQAYRQAGQPVVAIDADATSATFFCYKALQVRRVPLMEGDDINPRVFDTIVEEILTTDANFVIDTGSSSFVELNRYLLRNGIPQHVVEGGKRFIANIIIAAGQSLRRDVLELGGDRRSVAAGSRDRGLDQRSFRPCRFGWPAV